jgi:TonB family protein
MREEVLVNYAKLVSVVAMSCVWFSCASGAPTRRSEWRSLGTGPTVLEFPPGEPAARLHAGDGDPCRADAVSRATGLAQLAIDPTVEPYRPTLPPVLSRVGIVVPFLVRICVSENGSVQDVFIQKGEMLVDADVVKVLKTWRFKPHEVDGKRVPFRFPLNFYLLVRQP